MIIRNKPIISDIVGLYCKLDNQAMPNGKYFILNNKSGLRIAKTAEESEVILRQNGMIATGSLISEQIWSNLASQNQTYSVDSAHITFTCYSMWSESTRYD